VEGRIVKSGGKELALELEERAMTGPARSTGAWPGGGLKTREAMKIQTTEQQKQWYQTAFELFESTLNGESREQIHGVRRRAFQHSLAERLSHHQERRMAVHERFAIAKDGGFSRS